MDKDITDIAKSCKQCTDVCARPSDAKQKKHHPKKTFLCFFYYYLQFKGRKVFFNTLECLFILYTSCKTLHSECQLHFH